MSPSDADDNAIQDALRKLFNAQVQEQKKDQTGIVVVEDQGHQGTELRISAGPQGISFSSDFSPFKYNIRFRVQDQAFKLKLKSVQFKSTSIKQ